MSSLRNLAQHCFDLLVLSAAVILFARFLLPPLLPFLLGWGLSLLLRPIALYLSGKTKLSLKITAPAVLLTVGALLGSGIFFALRKLLTEGIRLLEQLADNADSIIDMLFAATERFALRFPFLGVLSDSDDLAAGVSEMVLSALTSLSASIPELVGKTAAALPSAMLFFTVTALAGYYFCTDLPGIRAALLKLLPKKARDFLGNLRLWLRDTLKGVAGAYCTLLFFTFAELLVGLLILRVDYAFTIAVITALADLLPLLGVGIVLVPWGIVHLLTGDLYTGVGLLVLFAVITLLRQILESRLVGTSIGLHPLASLLAIYSGLRLMGLPGVFLMPGLFLLARDRLNFRNNKGIIP